MTESGATVVVVWVANADRRPEDADTKLVVLGARGRFPPAVWLGYWDRMAGAWRDLSGHELGTVLWWADRPEPPAKFALPATLATDPASQPAAA